MERALALLDGTSAPRVLDVGVGSGAIALALKDERPDALVTGIDASKEALALARENAAALGLEVDLRVGGVEIAADGWDLVVSNPPYVETLEGLQPELRFEPEVALVGEGLHELIAERARTRALVLEVGEGQAARVAAALARSGYRNVTITPDLTRDCKSGRRGTLTDVHATVAAIRARRPVILPTDTVTASARGRTGPSRSSASTG